MQGHQNIHVLWQIRAPAVSAADWASLGLLSAWGRWDEQQHWLSLSTTAWVSQVLKLHSLPFKAAELPHSWQFWNPAWTVWL